MEEEARRGELTIKIKTTKAMSERKKKKEEKIVMAGQGIEDVDAS